MEEYEIFYKYKDGAESQPIEADNIISAIGDFLIENPKINLSDIFKVESNNL